MTRIEAPHSAPPQPQRRARCALPLRALALGALLLLGGALAAPQALAAPMAPQDAGQIDGNVLNGTNGGQPLANQSVALILHIGAGQQQVATTITDATGTFHFTGLATDQQDIYEASVAYQGATYTSDPISLAGNPRPPAITVLAYDATSSDAQVGVGRVTLLFDKPDIESGTIHVVELATMVNAGQQTFVGQTGPSNGMPMGLLRFALPDGYRNLLPQDGFGSGQIIQVNRGFASTAPVLPGDSQFAFSFTYPYDGTRSTFTYEAAYPTVQVVVLMPPGITVSMPGAKSLGTVDASGSKMQVWQAGPLLRGKTTTLTMSALPVPGQRPTFDPIWLDVIAALVALVGFGLVVYYLRRSSGRGIPLLPVRARSAPPTQRATAAADGATADSAARDTPDTKDTKADDLLRALARLDREHDDGKLEDVPYRVQREALKTELKARLVRSAAASAGEQR